jgi:hypothetical protein
LRFHNKINCAALSIAVHVMPSLLSKSDVPNPLFESPTSLPDLEGGATGADTIATVTAPTGATAAAKGNGCAWQFSFRGCNMHDAPPLDVCCVDGCEELFHHCCGTECEMDAYLRDNPGGDKSKCWYTSDGQKWCMKHHKYANVARFTATSNANSPTVIGPIPNDAADPASAKTSNFYASPSASTTPLATAST